MCSLLTDGKKYGILFDAGAGTPIIRPNYIQQRINNELKIELDKLLHLELVLSHADVDHWRLLAWDSALRNKIKTIFVAANSLKSLAIKDSEVIKKIKQTGGFSYQLNGGGKLEVLRSSPKKMSDNADCLVSLYSDTGNNRVLMPGDYVYDEMNADNSPAINSLWKSSYAAIVVPHHGAISSKKSVFKPQVKGKSIAFFSSGDNENYKHPAQESKDAHDHEKFKIVCKNTHPDIQAVHLIP
jgi:beta-lactamase superfamily II metal-dependent hydrolase